MIYSGPELREYYESRAGLCGDKARFLGRFNHGKLLGVVAVWNYTGINCELGWCGEPGWLSRALVRYVFAYVFGQLGCRRITGRINADNFLSLAMAARLGFVREGIMRDAGPDGQDVVIIGLLRKECRYGKF